jgi:hypothetical protein
MTALGHSPTALAVQLDWPVYVVSLLYVSVDLHLYVFIGPQIHRLKRDVLEAWAGDDPVLPVLSNALRWKRVEREYPHFTPQELRFVERRLIADGELSAADLTPLPEGMEEVDFTERR